MAEERITGVVEARLQMRVLNEHTTSIDNYNAENPNNPTCPKCPRDAFINNKFTSFKNYPMTKVREIKSIVDRRGAEVTFGKTVDWECKIHPGIKGHHWSRTYLPQEIEEQVTNKRK